MGDSLRESLEAAADEVDAAVAVETPVVESTPVETPTETNIETSDQQTPETTASQDASTPVADDPSKGVDAPSGDKPKSIEEVVGETLDKVPAENAPVDAEDRTPVPEKKLVNAPASWKGDAKELWNDLPPKAREEITRRELQTQQVLNDTALDRKRVSEVSEVLQPHMDMIQANYGGNPMQAVSGLLNVERALTSGNVATKAQIVAKIIQNFGIDVNALDALLSGGEMSPEIKQQSDFDRALDARMAPVNEYMNEQRQREQQVAQERQNQVIAAVEGLAVDATNYPYFNDVREDMADIIEMSAKRGVDISLKDAYDKATLINGKTAAAVDTRESAQADTQLALNAHQEAQKAKGASVSVSGNPTSVGTPPSQNTDLRSLISSQLDNGGQRV
jgi:hypothetical protein